jgi:hypothetical protein
VSPTVLVAVISIGYSGLWARRDDFRYTFPVGGYLSLGGSLGAGSAAGWEAMSVVHHHFETDETYSWRTVTLLGGPRIDYRRVLLGEVPNEGLSLSLGLAFGGR